MASSPGEQLREVIIRRWGEVAHRERLLPEIDAIFFESSGTKTFAGEAERRAFRERWLGRYLKHDPRWAYLALAGDGSVAGYLVGSLDSSAYEADRGYSAEFAPFMSEYAAHLHVNLAPAFRKRGIGRELIGAFAADAVRAGANGLHVITAAGARNVAFYERAGFSPLARSKVGERELVLLGRKLSPETA